MLNGFFSFFGYMHQLPLEAQTPKSTQCFIYEKCKSLKAGIFKSPATPSPAYHCSSLTMALRSSVTSSVMLLKCLVITLQAQINSLLFFFFFSGGEGPWAVIFDKCSLYHFIIRNSVVWFQSHTFPDMVPPAVSASSALDGHILHV